MTNNDEQCERSSREQTDERARDVRAQYSETCANYSPLTIPTYLTEPKNSDSPSTPPSSTSTREQAHDMDGQTPITTSFAYPCGTCGHTVHVADTHEQPHDCDPSGASLIRAWWNGHDHATNPDFPAAAGRAASVSSVSQPPARSGGEPARCQQCGHVEGTCACDCNDEPTAEPVVVSSLVSPVDRLDLAAIEREVELAHGTVSALCHGRERWRMSIPAEPERDPDLVISRALAHADALVAEVKRLREHSVTLNSIAWKIAGALGDVSADAETHVGDPTLLAEQLISEVKRLRATPVAPWCDHCGANCDGTHVIAGLNAQLAAAQAAVERVRALHQPIVCEGVLRCAGCGERITTAKPWPCPTIRALDGAS